MLIDIDKLETITNYARKKNLSRQHVYRLADNDELTIMRIDEVAFIYLDDKALNFERRRKVKSTIDK
jgi:hypothetical protein